jgi:TM2 domain-containing membrane protein YozV
MNGPGGPVGAMTTIYCTRCGQAMSIAAEHVRTTVACPHCAHRIDPWRVLGQHTPADPYAYDGGLSTRSRLVAGLLGIFLGPLGVHRFYLGYNGIGILQIILTCVTGIAGLWGFIEGILCLCGQMTDVDGLPLRD